jgi:hypothetical protein
MAVTFPKPHCSFILAKLQRTRNLPTMSCVSDKRQATGDKRRLVLAGVLPLARIRLCQCTISFRSFSLGCNCDIRSGRSTSQKETYHKMKPNLQLVY